MKFKELIIVILALLLVTSLLFFKIFTKSLYPVPGDLLVSFYFPYYSGDWDGYSPWTTHKELINADAIRQIYPWREFAFRQFKKGQMPLWNPYTFSGQALLANLQSGVFYPLNFVYFLTDPRIAWIILVISQPFLAGFFMYIASRSFKASKIASLYSSVVFIFSSYLITWMENVNVGHVYLYFPLCIFAINKFFELKKYRYLILLIIANSLAIFAGHPQTAIYLFLTTFSFSLYKIYEDKSKYYFALYCLTTLFSIALTSIQLFPTYQFYKESPISLSFAKEVFEKSIVPYQNLISFFASDFFGHPANNNFWSKSYGDLTPYFGVIPLIFTFWAAYKLSNKKLVKFFSAISLFFILCAIHGPITYFIKTFNPPLLDATTPSRFISISIFFMIIMSAFGLDNFLQNYKNPKFTKKFFLFLLPFVFIYIAFWVFSIIGTQFLNPKETWMINLSVTKRNLILPMVMFLSILTLASIIPILKKIEFSRYLITVFIFSITLVGGVYYSNKFLPVSPLKFLFPDHPLFYYLKHNIGLDRFYGAGVAHIDFNFPTHYQIYNAEGYDTLRFGRYAELLASGFSGKVPQSYLRSDGVFANEENGYRKRLFELLGVKYLLDKDDEPKTGADWHYERFKGDKVEGFWQYDKFQVYRREPTLPRLFLSQSYYVSKDDKDIIQKIYDPNFDLKTIILEKEPEIPISAQNEISIPNKISYEPNFIRAVTSKDENSLLFLSDSYSKDWKVYIDNNTAELLRADYALRAVAVPKGNHNVEFKYQPTSFKNGLIVSSVSGIMLLLFALFLAIRKKF